MQKEGVQVRLPQSLLDRLNAEKTGEDTLSSVIRDRLKTSFNTEDGLEEINDKLDRILGKLGSVLDKMDRY
mgnify:CR=1 FL=1